MLCTKNVCISALGASAVLRQVCASVRACSGVDVIHDPYITIHRGYFNDTLHILPSALQLAVLRLDGGWFCSLLTSGMVVCHEKRGS